MFWSLSSCPDVQKTPSKVLLFSGLTYAVRSRRIIDKLSLSIDLVEGGYPLEYRSSRVLRLFGKIICISQHGEASQLRFPRCSYLFTHEVSE